MCVKGKTRGDDLVNEVIINYEGEKCTFYSKKECTYLWKLLYYMENELGFRLKSMFLQESPNTNPKYFEKLVVYPLTCFNEKIHTDNDTYRLEVETIRESKDDVSYTFKIYKRDRKDFVNLGTFRCYEDDAVKYLFYDFVLCSLKSVLIEYLMQEEYTPIGNHILNGIRSTIKVRYEIYKYFSKKFDIFNHKYDLGEDEVIDILKQNETGYIKHYKVEVVDKSLTQTKLIRFYEEVMMYGKKERNYLPITITLRFDENGKLIYDYFVEDFIHQVRKMRLHYGFDNAFQQIASAFKTE